MHALTYLLQKPSVAHQLPSPFSSLIAPNLDCLLEQVPASFKAVHEPCTRVQNIQIPDFGEIYCMVAQKTGKTRQLALNALMLS